MKRSVVTAQVLWHTAFGPNAQLIAGAGPARKPRRLLITEVLQERYGAPALTLVGFRLWIHGRQFPQATDALDGNWLTVSICCETEGAVVWVEQDPALEVKDVQRLLKQCIDLRAGRKRKAALFTMEMLFEAQLIIDREGSLWIEVEVTQHSREPLPRQHHSYHFEASPAYLDRVIDDCQTILEAYPFVGEPDSYQVHNPEEFGFN